MKFLMYSTSGEGAQIAKKIELEGNTVGIYIKDKVYKTVFDGLLMKVEKPDDFIDKDTVVIFDISGNGDAADSFRKRGISVYGGSSLADKLEHDRKFGFDIMKQVGIKTPESKEFTDFKEGKAFVQKSNKRLVFKPSGSMPCKLTYCSKDAKELLAYMDFVEKHFGSEIESFILQEFIEGVVVSSEFFCDGNYFLSPGNHTVEDKKFMNDGLSVSTGCSGNITWPCEESNIFDDGISKMEKFCIDNQFIGQIDLNAVVDNSGTVYGLEWTPRFGYDATPTLLTLLNMDQAQFFSDISKSQFRGYIPLAERYAGGLRITIPPYPVESKQDPEKFSPSRGVPILNYEDFEEDLYFYEVMLEDDHLVHSGGSGVIACAMGVGFSPTKSMEYPEEIAEKICIPDKQYRTDLKMVLSKAVEEVENYAG